MVLMSIIKLPYNVAMEFIRFCGVLEQRNQGYLKTLLKQMAKRVK